MLGICSVGSHHVGLCHAVSFHSLCTQLFFCLECASLHSSYLTEFVFKFPSDLG